MIERLYTFQCPECGSKYTYDEPGEPLCDGPGDQKSHEPQVMLRIKVESRDRSKNVSPEEAKQRAKGPLLVPEVIVGLGLKVEGKKWRPKGGTNPWTGEEMDDSE